MTKTDDSKSIYSQYNMLGPTNLFTAPALAYEIYSTFDMAYIFKYINGISIFITNIYIRKEILYSIYFVIYSIKQNV